MKNVASHRRFGAEALIAAALLMLSMATALAQSAPIDITVTDKGCEPMRLTAPAGKSTFRVKNASRKALEWEILDGVIVVEERENILPGFTQSLSATLSPGQFQMTCGLVSNPKGALIVQASDKPETAGAPNPLDLVAPLAEYKVYVTREVDALVDRTKTFVAAIKAGDLEQARALYAPTRTHYERIEPVAELFDDLDKAIDVRADDFAKAEDDPAFTGYHKLEKLLFADKRLTDAAAPADKLMTDVVELQRRVGGLAIPANKMVGGAASLIEEVAATKLSGEEERYSHTDLWDFQANIDGAQKIYALLRPLAAKRDNAFVSRIDQNFATVDAILAKYKSGDAFKSYESVTENDRRAMKGPIATLAEDLSTLRGRLGLD